MSHPWIQYQNVCAWKVSKSQLLSSEILAELTARTNRYTLNICVCHFCLWHTTRTYALLMLKGDVGGQRTLRPYWRNYFEQTDAVVWVVDSGDRLRMQDCKSELHALLTEDVSAYDVAPCNGANMVIIDSD